VLGVVCLASAVAASAQSPTVDNWSLVSERRIMAPGVGQAIETGTALFQAPLEFLAAAKQVHQVHGVIGLLRTDEDASLLGIIPIRGARCHKKAPQSGAWVGAVGNSVVGYRQREPGIATGSKAGHAARQFWRFIAL